MFSVGPSVSDVTAVTVTDLERQLKTQLKQLQTQIKSDVRNEMTQVFQEGEFKKVLQETVSETVESTMGNIHKEQAQRRLQAAKIRRRRKTVLAKEAQAQLKTQALQSLRKGHTTKFADDGRLGSTKPAPDTADERNLRIMEGEAGGGESEDNNQPLITEPSGKELGSSGFMSLLESLVLNPRFELGSAVLVLLNIGLIGIDTQIHASGGETEKGLGNIIILLNLFFCIAFTMELILRLCVYRGQVWQNDYLFQSFTFDATMVALQIADQVIYAYHLNVHALSVLRVARIARTIRLVHLFDELSALVTGMTNSLSSMLWTTFLLVLLMYTFSIVIMQILLTTGDTHSNEDLNRWFGSVDRAVCTLFEITLGGRNWNDILQVLTQEVSPLMGVMIMIYIISSLFVLMNLVCGVFVDNVTKKVREDKDDTQAKKLSEHFTKIGPDGEEVEVTLRDFTEKLANDDTVRAYFASIDVNPDPANAKVIFDLIDVDGDGHLNGTEIAGGCLRLRGPAKALEMAVLNGELSQIHSKVSTSIAATEKIGNEMSWIVSKLGTLQSCMTSGRGFMDSAMDSRMDDSVMFGDEYESEKTPQ